MQRDGGAAQQRADLQVPHHPAAGGGPVEDIAGVDAGPEVVVQHIELEVLEHHAAVAVHDRLGQAAGAAGVDDPQRMVEGQPLRLEVPRVAGQQRAQVPGAPARRGELVGLGVAVQAGPQDHVLDRGQAVEQHVQQRAAVMVAPAPGAAVAADQHLGPDLAEAVEHRADTHVGRADRPDRAKAGAGQEGHHRLRRAGQVGGDPVIAADAHAAQRHRQRGHLAAQLRPAHPQRAPGRLQHLVAEQDGGQVGAVRLVGMAEDLAGVVELRARKPDRARHPAIGQRHHRRDRRLDVEPVPQGAPEAFRVIDRPLPEIVVVVEMPSALQRQPVEKRGDPCLGVRHGRVLS
jgi:hypothetical protein